MSNELLANQLRVLNSHAQIVGVHYNELRAKSEEIGEDELGAPIFRLGEVVIPHGTVCVEPVMTFQVPVEHAGAVNSRSATAYVNDSGVVHILPFVRQALIDMSTRVLRSPVVMPIFGPDDLQFELPPMDFETEESE